jgi:putative acetyltransferase
VRVRPEASGDVRAIYELQEAAFGRNDESLLIDRLRAEKGFEAPMSLVADEDGALIGHVLFTHLQLAAGNRSLRAAALGPVGVHPDHQRKGVADRLVRYGLEYLKKEGYEAAVVLGDPAYYGRFGFSAQTATPIICSYSGPHFMAIELRPGALKTANQFKAVYHKAFAEAGL